MRIQIPGPCLALMCENPTQEEFNTRGTNKLRRRRMRYIEGFFMT